MEISIIVLSYNHPEITARTLSSILPFSKGMITLVHNGSTTKNVALLKQQFPQIQHLEISQNRGFTGGANIGLKHAFRHHDWCLFLTNDCQVELLGEIPSQPAMVCPKILSRKSTKIDSLGGLFSPVTGKLRHAKSEIEFLESKDHKYAPGTAFLLHKKVFQETGGFDQSLFTYWEDVDFSMRLQAKGFSIILENQWVLRHSIGKTCHKHSLYTLYYYQRNRKRVAKAYCPPSQIWKLRFHLYRDYLYLCGRLLRRRRFKDLQLLYAAIRDVEISFDTNSTMNHNNL